MGVIRLGLTELLAVLIQELALVAVAVEAR
jgi:hypothetical protein